MLLTIQNVFPYCNLKCEIQHTLIQLHPNECSQEFNYYPFVVKLDKCAGSCNTLNDLFHNICVTNKTKNLSIHVFFNKRYIMQM